MSDATIEKPASGSVWRNRHTGEDVRVRSVLSGTPSYPDRPCVEYVDEADRSLLAPLLAHLAGRHPVWPLSGWHENWEPKPRKWSLATECYAYTDDTHWQGPDIPEGERVEVLEAAPLYALVDEQAEDEGLWSTRLDGSTSIAEAHLQQELRRLHALIESGRRI